MFLNVLLNNELSTVMPAIVSSEGAELGVKIEKGAQTKDELVLTGPDIELTSQEYARKLIRS